MNVPLIPHGVLQLVHEVDAAVDQANEETSPTSALLHCSAGVGRTSVVIVLDAILNGIRCELQKCFTLAVSSTSEVSSECSSNSDEAHMNFDNTFATLRPAYLMRSLLLSSTVQPSSSSSASLASGKT
jgi:protein tyrosine phosphatase